MGCAENVFRCRDWSVDTEFPVIVFRARNCEQLPEVVTYAFVGTWLSIYVPGHVKVQLVSKSNKTAWLYGPSIVPNINALLLFWDDKTHVESSDIKEIKVVKQWEWNLYVHNLVSKKQDLRVGDHVIEFDRDTFFNKICWDYRESNPNYRESNPNPGYHCDCFNDFLAFSHAHPGTPAHVELLNPNCQPAKHYMHSLAPQIGSADPDTVCLSMLNSMLKNKTLQVWEEGGQKYFKCNNKYLSNVVIPDRNKRFDDPLDKVLESQENQAVPLWLLYLVLVIAFVLLVCCCVKWIQYFSLLKTRHDSSTR
jgi:hypothetical protein